MNPLIEPLGEFRDMADWPSLLESNPLDTFPEKPSLEERDRFLAISHKRFAVTKASLRLANDVQSMIRGGYQDRDPTRTENTRRLYRLAELSGTFRTSAPTFYPNARCLVLSAITGMGKSLTVERILDSYDQVVRHGINESAGWLKHTQLIHLTVKMSDSGSRGGFVDAVIHAMDTVLGTDYFNAYKGERTVGRRSLRVAQLLALHSVGLLVIEEMQPENFMESRFKKELNIFFLSVLSFGVPLLLVGNPRAFERLGEHKQTERRYYSYEPITLWPYASADDKDWSKAIAPAIWSYQVVDNAAPFDSQVASTLWECSGGVPGYAQKLVVEVQRSILRRDEKALTVEAVRRHYCHLASFKNYRPLIQGLVTKDLDLISDGIDIPVDAFEARWNSIGHTPKETRPDASHRDGGADPPTTGDWASFKKNRTQRDKAKQTKRKNKRHRASAMQNTLDDNDIRRSENLANALSKTLDELDEKAASKKKTKRRQHNKKRTR